MERGAVDLTTVTSLGGAAAQGTPHLWGELTGERISCSQPWIVCASRAPHRCLGTWWWGQELNLRPAGCEPGLSVFDGPVPSNASASDFRASGFPVLTTAGHPIPARRVDGLWASWGWPSTPSRTSCEVSTGSSLPPGSLVGAVVEAREVVQLADRPAAPFPTDFHRFSPTNSTRTPRTVASDDLG